MIIGQSLNAPILTGGMKSRIVVTCTGATSLTLTTPSSIVIPGVAVGNVYTFDNLSLTGTYVVTASNGSQTKTQNVLVDVVGIYNVTVVFALYLYNEGNENTAVTGGLRTYYCAYINGSNVASKQSNYLKIYDSGNNYCSCGFSTSNKINLSGYTKINFDMYVPTCSQYNGHYPNIYYGFDNTIKQTRSDGYDNQFDLGGTYGYKGTTVDQFTSRKTWTTDININSDYYVRFVLFTYYWPSLTAELRLYNIYLS